MTDREKEDMAAAVRVAASRLGGVAALSEAVGVSRQTVYRWLNAEVEIDAEHAKCCADVARMELYDFRPDLRP